MNLYIKYVGAMICVWFTFLVGHAQITVIDNKGTLKAVDTSKWSVNNGFLYIKNNWNVGIGVNNPQAKFHTSGTVRFADLGTSNSNSSLLTTDASGNVTVRSFASLLSGNAITSLNGLTGTSQTFSLGTTGTDFNVSSSGTIHTFNLPTASASNRGALSPSDWTLFNNKQNNITAGTNSQYWRGDKTWQTLNTTAVTEGSNLYFTNTRARNAISLTTSGTGAATYNSSTGVLNIPTTSASNFTLNGLTPTSQTFNTGTSGSDFSINSSGSVHTFNIPTATSTIRGLLSSQDWSTFNNKQDNITAGTNLQYWRGDKTWQTLNTGAVTESSNLYFTNARARSAISLSTSGSNGSATYDANTGVLNIPNYAGNTFTLNGLTPSSQTLNTGASGSDFNITSNGSSHIFNIPSASASNRGLLNAGDWTTFNNKLSSINASTPLVATVSGSTINLQLNRSNLTTGTSNNSASTPLTLDGNATNALVSANNLALNINNTAPLWNAFQLRGRNISTNTPSTGQTLKWDGNNWTPTDEAAAVNWLRTGNNNATYGTHFLGNTNDVPLTLRSNNTPMLEVGRRETLGLWDTTNTGLYPYDQQNASVMYVRGTNGNSALQFESGSSQFYKPIFFTDSDGNFQMRGSSAGTDFFELGSTGTNNNGGMLFTIGDDGDEPMIFRKYNYTPVAYVEMLRLQGTGLNNTVRVGVNTGGVIANSTFQVVGSVTNSIITTSTALTLTEEHHTVIVTANVTITLPAANTCLGRVYIVKKTHNSSGSLSTYINTSGSSSTSFSRGVYYLQSDGTNWQQL